MSAVPIVRKKPKRQYLPPLEGEEGRLVIQCDKKKNKPRMAIGVCEKLCKKKKNCDEYYNSKKEIIENRNVG